jgi:hypothetical protein
VTEMIIGKLSCRDAMGEWLCRLYTSAIKQKACAGFHASTWALAGRNGFKYHRRMGSGGDARLAVRGQPR